MRIALVSPYDFAVPGGVTNHIGSLANQLVTSGHYVRILTPLSQQDDAPAGQNIIPLGRPVSVPTGGSVARLSLSVWLLPKIRELLARERFDIVHIHEPLAPLLPLSVLHFSESVNVGTFHAYHSSNRMYGWSHPVLRHWFRKLDGRTAVSPMAMKFVSRFFPGEYRIIPNGIELDYFARPRPPIPEFDDGKMNILFVGRMEKRKGLRYLIEAYSRLKWEHPNIRLIIVGPGTPGKDVYRILGERCPEDVVFTGPVPYGELPRYYQSCHIFCAPATGKESFGIVLLEAMACSKPIVCTRIEGYGCVLTHGQEGLMAPPQSSDGLAEALATLIGDADLRAQLGARGRQTAERYRWERVAAETMDYYQALLEERRGVAV
ncbi:MAG: glycosyltransferase family 4 protein [Chloroflexota bacterium]|nr:glycosyltransferase family 4 protein [Chloroflexota bacterium]